MGIAKESANSVVSSFPIFFCFFTIITTMDIIWYTALCMSLIAFASARSKGSMDQHALRLNNEAEQEMDTLVEETRQLNEEMEDSATMFKAGSDAISDSSSKGISTDDLFASGAAALGANAGDSESKFNGLRRSKTGNRLKDIHVSKQSKGGCATVTCLPHDHKCKKDKKNVWMPKSVKETRSTKQNVFLNHWVSKDKPRTKSGERSKILWWFRESDA